jgi:hypothetical protein
VHSNCLAPSRDIAVAFAQGNRIHHLLSTGLWHLNPDGSEASQKPPAGVVEIDVGEVGEWRAVGTEALRLVEQYKIVADYLGLKVIHDKVKRGTCSGTLDNTNLITVSRHLCVGSNTTSCVC